MSNPGPSRSPSLFGGVWLVSFADLVSILVSFFIMLYSMSDVPPAAWNALREGLARGLGRDGSEVSAPVNPLPPPRGEAIGINLDYLAVLLGQRMAAESEGTGIAIARRDDRIVIALSGPDLLAPNHGGVSDQAARRLGPVGGILSHVRNRVEVVAVAPDLLRGQGERAWVRSIGHARAVVEMLRRSGYSRDIVALATPGAATDDRTDAAARSGGETERIEIHVLGVTP